MGTLAVLLIIAVVAYLISLRRHPLGRDCRRCGGSGEHRGFIFRYATRACTRCGGRPRRARLGIRVLHGSGPVWGESEPAKAAAARARNHGR